MGITLALRDQLSRRLRDWRQLLSYTAPMLLLSVASLPAHSQTVLRFASASQTVEVNACSNAVVIERTRSRAIDSVNIMLQSTSQEMRFFTDSDCDNQITQVTLRLNKRIAAFYFKSSAVGSADIQVSATAHRSATQTQTIQSTAPPPPSPTPLPTPPPVAGVVFLPSFPPTSTAGDIVGFRFENPTDAPLSAQLVSFGQPFAMGQVSPTANLLADFGGTRVPVQMDVKTTHPDGSVRMAVLTVKHPAIAANSAAPMMLSNRGAPQGAAVELSQLPQYSLLVTIEMTAGASGTFTIDIAQKLREALANRTASYWMRGALATQARVEIPVTSSMRIVADVTQYTDGGIVTDIQFNNDIAMALVGGTLSYNATLNHNGQISRFPSLVHGQYQQWAKVLFSNGSKPAVNVQHDSGYLVRARAVLPVRLDYGINSTKLDEWSGWLSNVDVTAPFAVNGITQYMPGTGGRPDIGPYTAYNTAYLITQDVRARDFVLAQADAAASIPWHYFDARNRRWLNVDDYPNVWLDGRGGQGNSDDKYTGGITQQPQDTKGWTPDTAHMPNLSSVPYMTTGRRFYLDQLHAQASFAMMAAWTAPRNAFDQVIGGKKWTGLAVFGNQVRGAAWSLRQFQESAYYGADGTFEKSHFERMVKNNVDFLLATAPVNQEQQGEVFGYIPGDYGNAGHLAPWQQDYFISALALASRQGSSEAVQLMNWTKNFQIGRYVAKPGWNERDGATYNIPYQTSSGAYIKTWAEMGAALVAEGGSNGIDSWTQAQNGDYAQTGMMTLSLIYDATGDTAAKNAFTRIMSLNPPYCDAGTFRRDPNFNYGIVQ